MSTLVTVIVPVFRDVHFLPGALRSILAQTHLDFEVVVVDDGSPEDIRSVIEPFLGHDAIQFVSQSNGGVSSARNLGLSRARGCYVAFLDHDDQWHPSKLELQLAALIARPAAALCHAEVRYVDAAGATLTCHAPIAENVEGSCLARLVLGNPVVTSSVLLRRDVALELGGFDVRLHHAEDYDLWLRVARRWELAYVDQPLVDYRVHSGSATAQRARMLVSTLDIVCRHLREVPGLRDEIGRLNVQRRISLLHASLSRGYFEERQWTNFLRHWVVALVNEPTIALDRGLPSSVANRLRWYALRLGIGRGTV
jgi:glycosyltransferase involved in cell wall biosynthesis